MSATRPMPRTACCSLLLGALTALLALPLQAVAQQAAAGAHAKLAPAPWAGISLGGGAFQSLAPAPAAGRDALAASVEVGYRFTPSVGVGLELGTIAPLGGCAEWNCGSSANDFAPGFSRLFAFGEYRGRNSGWSVRAGLGLSRFCYQRHWSPDAWSWFDTLDLLLNDDLLDEDTGGTGAWRCDARRMALGGSVSVGYDWPKLTRSHLSMGVRLSAEAANYGDSPAIGLPAFRHRALILSLHLNLN